MTTQKPSRVLVIDFEIFANYSIHVEFAKDLAQAVRQTKEIADSADGLSKGAQAVTIYNDEMVSYIFLKPGTTYGTIAHEALHAVNQMMNKVGVSGDEENDENTAYHLGFVVNHIVAFRKRQMRGNHGKTRHPHRGKKLRSR